MTRWVIRGLAAAVALGGVGCDDSLLYEERDHTYDGPPLVEFAPTLPDGSYSITVGFVADSQETQTLTVGIQYIGEPPAADVTGSFSVVDGTAVNEEHYRLPGGTGFTIPAGQNRTDVSVQLLGGGLANGESVSLTLELSDGPDYDPSPNYSAFQITASKEGG